MAHYAPFVRRDGVTPAEQYLKLLCDNTFLSLWSYPGLFRDQGAKEVADLLVVFEQDVIIFSDKDCAYPTTPDAQVNWERWFRTAIVKGAKQAWGAQRWLTAFPNRLFLDPTCTQPFPFDLPAQPRFHIVLVAHGISDACKAQFNGGSGSMLLRSDLKGFDAHTVPFAIGDLDPNRTFVHVFDDTSLDIIMTTLDTIADFTQYLRDKEALLRSQPIMAAGEEELLAAYLMNPTNEGLHAFPVPEGSRNGAAFAEGHWDRFQHSPPRLAQVAHDKVSYLWDALIEKFNQHAMDADQYLAPPGGLKDSERILRFYAREPRLRRRLLSQELLDMVRITPPDQRRLRIVPPARAADPYFVLLVFPLRKDKKPEENRRARANFLTAAMQVAKLEYPAAQDIVGFATESGKDNQYSEDSAYYDARIWTAADAEHARDLQRRLDILTKPQVRAITYDEYPSTGAPGRKAPCPCGSGKKYKRCHGH